MIALSSSSFNLSFAFDSHNKQYRNAMKSVNVFEPHIERYSTPYSETPFFQKGMLKLKLKNMYLQQHSFTFYPTFAQWGQGLMLDFQSGYMNNVIGFDAGFAGGMKLYSKNENNHPATFDQLLTRKDGTAFDFDTFYGHIERLNLKVRVGNEAQFATLRYGFFPVNSALISDSSSRLLPSTSQGGSLEVSLMDSKLKGYGYWLTDTIKRTETERVKFLTADNQKVDHVWLAGASYRLDATQNSSLFVNAEVAESEKYQRQYFAQASYDVDFAEDKSFLANVQYRRVKGLANWSPARDGHNGEAFNFNVNGLVRAYGLRVAGSFSYTDAPYPEINNTNAAQIDRARYAQMNSKLADNMYASSASWTCRQIHSFQYHKESVIQGSVAYDFAEKNIPGLNVKLTHTYGFFPEDSLLGLDHEQETDLGFRYDFQDSLKGIALSVESAWYSIQGSQEYPGVGRQKIDARDFRFIASYEYPM